MSKIINCSIDVSMISKDKIKIHANGSHYWNFSVLEKKETDDYGNTHYVVEGQTKDERDAKAPKNYMKSSGKEYVFGSSNGAPEVKPSNAYVDNGDDDDDGLPF